MSPTVKQRAFIEEYPIDFNATRAAERAGYSGNDNVLAAQGSRLLKNAKVAEAISQRLRESAMLADEALAILADQARADLGPFIVVDKGDVGIDIKKLKEAGLAHLIKSITPTRYGTKIEFYDKQYALNLILKAHGAFTESLDLTTDGKPIRIIAIEAVAPEEIGNVE